MPYTPLRYRWHHQYQNYSITLTHDASMRIHLIDSTTEMTKMDLPFKITEFQQSHTYGTSMSKKLIKIDLRFSFGENTCTNSCASKILSQIISAINRNIGNYIIYFGIRPEESKYHFGEFKRLIGLVLRQLKKINRIIYILKGNKING